MSQKQITIFVIVLFSIIIILLLRKGAEKSNVYNEIQQAELSNLENPQFYMDFLRDQTGINKPIAPEHLPDLLTVLKTMKKSNIALKSLHYEARYRIRMNLNVAESRLLTINIIRTTEYGNTGIITLEEGETLVASLGTFTSKELLAWVEAMSTLPEYEGL